MRHLWLAIWEGLIEHRRALLTLLGIAAGVLVVLQAVFYVASSSAGLCGSCHIMAPYVAAWQNSTHRDVACVSCHREYRWVLSTTYFKYATGLYSLQLRAEVPDARCLACHERQDLDPDKPFLEGIHFSHKNHLGEMRRGKRLHCTSCHSGLTMGEGAESATHVAVEESVCFTCHFKGAEKGQAVTGCLVCHGPPSKVVTHQGFEFDHGSYLQRNVRCNLCHVEVVRGDANVPRSRCATCHVSRIEAYEDVERVHDIHLRRRLIDCKRCHTTIEHGNVQMAAALGERCENCHKPAHTPQEQMYVGIGGTGVPDTPSTMFLAQVACDSCHGEPGRDPRKGAEELRKSCVTCHGAGYDRMVDDWISELSSLASEVRSVLARAEAVAGSKRADPALAAARHNVEFVARARGEHNIHYAVDLLRLARRNAVEVLARAGQTPPAPPPVLASPSGYCRVCHSTSHLGSQLPFAGMTYDHNRHLAAGLTCDTCHSLEEHGKTSIEASQCMACHHGKTQPRSCETCHDQQASLYHGKLAGTEVAGEADVMAQADTSCTDCHDLASGQPLVATVQKACVNCHEAGYDAMVVEWINEDQARVQQLAVLLASAQAALGQTTGPAAASRRQALAEAERIYRALLAAKGAHNPSLAQEASARARKLLEWAAPPATPPR
jgi:hypothetical protein